MDNPRHLPVLVDRVVALVAPALDVGSTQPVSDASHPERPVSGASHPERPVSGASHPVLVDATLGLGGHTEAILTNCPNAHVVGLDRDEAALRLAADRLEPFGGRITFVHAVYDELPDVLSDLGLPQVQGVLFDLGVSSMQLDEAERGFAYSHDAPLDMRMDPSTGITAAEVLNTYSSRDLARLLSRYGEEKFARRIADSVVREREVRPFDTSARLVELIRDSIPAPARRTGGNPAKRTFQALRIEVNDELRILDRALPAAIDALAVGGRIVVMSYQSLEDKIAKRHLVARSTSTAPHDLPVVPEEAQPELRLLTRGADKADADEIELNPRAASVRVRAAERVRRAA